MNHPKLKVGLFGVGLNTYWPQFDGLQQRLESYVQQVAQRLHRPDVEVVNLGMVDDTDKAFAASQAFRQSQVDLIFLYATTYAVSSTVLAAVAKVKAPVIVLNLQPEASIDYKAIEAMRDRTRMTGEWLAYCASCTVPEIANVFRRARIPFHQITGVLHGDPHVWQEVNGWLNAAKVAHTLAYNRLGLLGRYYNGMLDIYTDITLQCATFGGHVEMLEMDELARLCESVAEQPGGSLQLLCAEAESVAGPILEIGNTNSRYRFKLGARGFIERWNAHGPAHHCAIGVGHVANRLHKLAALLGIECNQVC